LLPSNEQLEYSEEKSHKNFSLRPDNFQSQTEKNSISNPSTKKKSFLNGYEMQKSKLLLPKNHRKVYENFK